MVSDTYLLTNITSFCVFFLNISFCVCFLCVCVLFVSFVFLCIFLFFKHFLTRTVEYVKKNCYCSHFRPNSAIQADKAWLSPEPQANCSNTSLGVASVFHHTPGFKSTVLPLKINFFFLIVFELFPPQSSCFITIMKTVGSDHPSHLILRTQPTEAAALERRVI